MDGQVEGLEQLGEGLKVVLRAAHAQAEAQLGGHAHAGGHRLAVGPGLIVPHLLKGVAHGMAEVEEHPAAGVPLVLLHYHPF